MRHLPVRRVDDDWSVTSGLRGAGDVLHTTDGECLTWYVPRDDSPTDRVKESAGEACQEQQGSPSS